MSDFTKNARVTVYINGQNAATELDKLSSKVQKIKKELAAAGKDTPLGKELKTQLRQTQDELDRMRDKAGLAGMSIRQLETEARRLKNLRNSVTPGSDAFNELNGKLSEVKKRIQSVSSELGPMAQAWQKVSIEAKAAIGIFAGSMILSEGGQMINSLGKMDDQLADIKKSANLSAKDLAILNEELGKIKTRSSRTELRDLAYEAGKLGKDSVEDVLAFVRAADQIKIALGRDLGTEAITEIGKLTTIFKLDDAVGIEKGMLMIGSAINEVGAASTASEGYIVDFLKRTSGVASIARVTAPELMGLAGTLDSVGQTSEVSSTAISKLLTKMGSDVGTYAKLAGKSVDEFRATMNRSGLEALLQVFENVGKSQSGLEQLTATLGDLGVDGGRVVGVFGALAENIDEVRRQTKIANTEFLAATSITKEVEIRNQSLGAITDGLKKDLIGLWQNNQVKEGIRSMVQGVADFVRVLKDNANFIGILMKNLITATIVWGAYKLMIIASNFALKEGTLFARGYALAQQMLAGNISVTTGAMKVLNAVTRTNPFLLIATAVIALDGALRVLSRNTSSHIALEKERKSTLQDLNKLTNELEASQKAMNAALQNFNLLTREERENAVALANAQQRKLSLQLEELKARRNSIAMMANEATIRDKVGNLLKSGGNLFEATAMNMKSGVENSKEATKQLDEQIKTLTTSIDELDKSRTEMNNTQNAEQLGDAILGKTIEQLNEKTRKYQQALALATLGTADFIRISEKLKKVQDALAKLNSTGGPTVDNKAAEKAANDLKKIEEDKYKSALDSLKDYWHAGDELWKEILSSKTKTDQDIIDSEERKWNVLLSKNRRAQDELQKVLNSKNATSANKSSAKGGLEQLIVEEYALMDGRTKAISDKEMELAHKRLMIIKTLNEEISDLNNTEQENEIKSVEQKYEKLAAIAADNNDIDLVTEIEEQKAKAVDAVREKYAKLDEDRQKEHMTKILNMTEQGANVLLGVFQKVSDVRMAKDQYELDKDRLANDQKKKNLDRQLKLKIISQDRYNSEVEKLDEELSKKQLQLKIKEAKRNKLFTAFQIGIDTASAIIKMLRDPGGTEGIALAAFAGAAGAASLGAVLSTPLPQYGKGTIFTGMKHSSDPGRDGNPVIDRRTGLPIATVEAGELLLSSAFVGNNPELTQLALRVSQNEGGRRITAEEIYGRPSRIDVVGIQETFSRPQFKSGAQFSPAPNSDSNPFNSSASAREIVDRLDRMIELNSKPSRSYLVRKDLADMDNEDSFFKKYIELT